MFLRVELEWGENGRECIMRLVKISGYLGVDVVSEFNGEVIRVNSWTDVDKAWEDHLDLTQRRMHAMAASLDERGNDG